jgi:hypothetical protein
MSAEPEEMNGLAVHDVDDTRVGDVVDFFVDANTNEPEWLVVEAGAIAQKSVLVPVEGITRDQSVLKTPYPKEMIMTAPSVRGPAIDKDTEQALYGYYHVRRELPGRTTGRAAYEQNRAPSSDYRLRSWKSSAA